MEEETKKQKPVKYIVSARLRGNSRRYSLTSPGDIEWATGALSRLEQDPFFTHRFMDFRIQRHDGKTPVWTLPKKCE